MLPSTSGGLGPRSIHLFALLCALLVAAAGRPAPAGASPAPARWWMETAVEQLYRADPVGAAAGRLLDVRAGVTLAGSLGLGARMRVDAPVGGTPGTFLSMDFQRGGASFGLTLKLEPPALPVGVEYHRMAGHVGVSPGADAAAGADRYLLDGGASHFFDLTQRGFHHRLRLGYGSMGVDTDLAPALLGLHGFLPSHQAAAGPFVTLSAERLRLAGFVGRAGVMLMLDTGAHRATRGDYMAWGATMHRALSGRLVLGMSYLGGNTSLPGSGASSMASLYLRLRFGGAGR